MDIEIIKTLIEEFKQANLTTFKLKHDNFELELKAEKGVVVQPQQVAQTPVISQLHESAIIQTEVVSTQLQETINSPMVGTFYLASSPTSPPFVSVGKAVKKGDIVCIIEAMKLMNEVEADKDGVITKILAENEQLVGFGTPLFVIE